jgi:Cu(I)-responsive transcriptional regulator
VPQVQARPRPQPQSAAAFDAPQVQGLQVHEPDAAHVQPGSHFAQAQAGPQAQPAERASWRGVVVVFIEGSLEESGQEPSLSSFPQGEGQAPETPASRIATMDRSRRIAMTHPMNIGEAADAAGVTAKSIRHYEALGLLAEPARSEAGYRQYSANDVAVLRFIRQSRSLGFSTTQIGELLALRADGGRRSQDVKALASRHLAELERKLGELAQMKAELERVAHDCHGDHRSECAILRKLSTNAPTAPAPADAEASAPPDARPRKTPRPTPRQRQRPVPRAGAAEAPAADHAGLSAWMRGLGAPIEHDRGTADPSGGARR